VKTIELDFQIMEAIHTFDLTKVQATRKYREMVKAGGGRPRMVDATINHLIAECRTKRDKDPKAWAGIVETTSEFAAQERENRRAIQ
jgi:hypothetical protein